MPAPQVIIVDGDAALLRDNGIAAADRQKAIPSRPPGLLDISVTSLPEKIDPQLAQPQWADIRLSR